MKVVILGTAYPYRGGLSAFNERLAKEYLSMGYEVEIVTFKLQYPSLLFPGKTQYSSEPAPVAIPISRQINSCNPFNWFKVGRKVARKRPDIVIIKYWLPFMAPCLGTLARVIRRKSTAKVISILDNVIPHEHRIGDKLFSRYFVNSVNGFVAMSRSVLSDLDIFTTSKPRAFCAHPLYDNYAPAIDKQQARKNLSLPVDGRYILFFGFIRAYKGLDLLLHAMSDERVKASEVKLIVAGEFYGDSKQYTDLIARLKLENVILHTRFIADSEVNNYFCAADLVVQPYKSATQSGVTQISFHYDKPMVVTNVGGLSEIVPDHKAGLVVEPSSEQIANAIIEYFSNNLEPSMVDAVREEKQKYSWKQMTNTIQQLVEKS